MGRKADLDRLYQLFGDLEAAVGGMRKLENCTGYMDWPDRGVYFFFSPVETRTSTNQLRLTRIGTHAVSEGSQTSLWNRLRTHRGANRGTYEGGGNHRGSVFRKRVGEALITRDDLQEAYPDWGQGNSADRELRMAELEMELRVSDYIRTLPFLWVGVNDEPGPESDRSYLERNAIALVSNLGGEVIDPRPTDWLGRHSPVKEIRESGLWNIDHVDEPYDPDFLDSLSGYIDETAADQKRLRPNKLETVADQAGRSDERPKSFNDTWNAITRFAESESVVSTLSHGNDNEIRVDSGAVQVRNLNTGEWREIDKEDFRFAFELLSTQGELTLNDIEPELAGRKSMVTAILTKALDLDFDRRPLRVYR